MKTIKKLAPVVLFILSILMIGTRIFKAIPTLNKETVSSDDVMIWDSRLQSLRNALPDNINQAGYLDQSLITAGAVRFDGEEFFLMQYSVAPIALEIGIEELWIIGNFDDDTNLPQWLEANIGKYESQNFGFGLYLIHKLEE
jgi:hypothetical protein